MEDNNKCNLSIDGPIGYAKKVVARYGYEQGIDNVDLVVAIKALLEHSEKQQELKKNLATQVEMLEEKLADEDKLNKYWSKNVNESFNNLLEKSRAKDERIKELEKKLSDENELHTYQCKLMDKDYAKIVEERKQWRMECSRLQANQVTNIHKDPIIKALQNDINGLHERIKELEDICEIKDMVIKRLEEKSKNTLSADSTMEVRVNEISNSLNAQAGLFNRAYANNGKSRNRNARDLMQMAQTLILELWRQVQSNKTSVVINTDGVTIAKSSSSSLEPADIDLILRYVRKEMEW